MTPVSLFAPWSASSARPGRRHAASSQSRSSRPSGRSGRDLRRRKPMSGEDAGVLAGRNDEPLERYGARPAAEMRIERRVSGLRAAGHERHATRRRAREPRDIASRLLHDPARRAPFRMDGGGIAARLHRRERSLARLGTQRRGGVMVEVGSAQRPCGGHCGSHSGGRDAKRGEACGFSLQLPAPRML